MLILHALGSAASTSAGNLLRMIHVSSLPLYFLLLLSVCTSCNAQNKDPNTGTTKDRSRLIKNHFITEYPDEFFYVQCGLNDRTGHLWFGCAGDGIYYYDGASFTNFTRNDGLCHNDILCCAEDKNGDIWFGTRNGVIVYRSTGKPPVKTDFTSLLIREHVVNPATGEKIPYTYQPADNFVWNIYPDRSGKIWFGTNNGLYTCDLKPSGRFDFNRFLDNPNIINAQHLNLKDITSIKEDPSGKMWFVSGFTAEEGICCYDGTTLGNFTPEGIRSSYRTITEMRNGNLLFLNSFHGVYVYDGTTFNNLSEKIGITGDTLTNVIEDKAGTLWFARCSNNMKNGGDGGVWRYDGESLELLTTKNGLSHNCVFTIVEDTYSNIWFGTRNTGLCRYDGRTFTNFTDE